MLPTLKVEVCFQFDIKQNSQPCLLNYTNKVYKVQFIKVALNKYYQ